MKTVDLRHETITIDELLKLASEESLVVRSKEGGDFVVEAAGSFEREVEELARSRKFMTFLQERFQEEGRVPIAEIERRLARPPLGDEDKP